MQGLHLTADLHDCPRGLALLTELEALRRLCLREVGASGLSAVGEVFHRFEPEGGVTGVVLLAESHLAVHTWPELRAVTIDLYVCNYSADNRPCAETLMQALCAAFAPGRIQRQRLERGALVDARPQ